MHEPLYIAKALQLIECKINRGNCEQWTYDDFKKLQKLIFEASSINLSTHTLERLYGKLKTHKNYKPQADTKNALAIFLGCTDWDNFKSQNPLSQQEITTLSEPKMVTENVEAPQSGHSNLSKNTSLKKAIIAIFFCISIAAAFVIFNKNSTSTDVNFKAANAFGSAPHTVKFVYDLSHLEGDGFSLFFPPFDTMRLEKSDRITYKTYLYPGRYTAYLLQGKKPVAQTPVYIQTNGWQGRYYSIYENESKRSPLPDTALISGGRLYTPDTYVPDSIKKIHYDISYSNIRDFNVDGDNAAFETRFKNDPKNGSKVCYDMWFKLIGTEGILKMHFLESGCFGYVQMIFGDKTLRGYKYDLSPFSIDMKKWEKARLEVVNKHIQISLNDAVIYKTDYSKSVGKIVGIEITSKTSGETDYVKLYNEKRKLVYADDFGGKAE